MSTDNQESTDIIRKTYVKGNDQNKYVKKEAGVNRDNTENRKVFKN